MRPRVTTDKHYSANPLFVVSASSLTQVVAVHAVQIQNKDAAFEVEEGSVIEAVYFEFWIANAGSGASFGVCTIEKLMGGQPNQTFTQSLNLGTYPNKKNILFTFEGLIPPSTVNPIPIIRRYVKIPRGKQRFGLDDKLVINFTSDGDGKNVCGFVTYKEQK